MVFLEQGQRHLDYVSSHIDQTYLVESLLSSGQVGWDSILGWEADGNGDKPEIFQWKVFTNFWTVDHERLIRAKIPVLESNYGTWVGITSY